MSKTDRKGIRLKAIPAEDGQEKEQTKPPIDLASATDPHDVEAKEAPASCPEGWKLTATRVFQVKEKEEGPEYIPVCGHLRVTGRTTGPHGEWGLVLVFRDHDGNPLTRAIPAARLHEEAGILARELATAGLNIIPGKERLMLAYLASWEVGERILSVKRLGWLEDKTGSLAFVLPSGVICRDGLGEVVYQPDRFAPTTQTLHAGGSTEGWRDEVAIPAWKHPMMRLALSAGLAPVLLPFAGMDSFIAHFWGQSSKGKTTLAQIAASAWGCGADPADAPSLAFARRWNATGNGLEALAEAHSDLPLVLDELGANAVNDLRPAIYQLAGGQGKVAMNSHRELREPKSWRTIAVSTGEVSLHGRMSDVDGTGTRQRPIKSGLSHRAVDIEVFDIADAIPSAQRGPAVQALKRSCAVHYGHAGPSFVRALCERFDDAAEVRSLITERLTAISASLSTDDLAPEIARAIRRFALIAVAGELAVEMGVVPGQSGEAIEAAHLAARQWLSGNAETDSQRIIASVRDFILKHEARFQPINEPEPEPKTDKWGHEYQPDQKEKDPVRGRVGFVDRSNGRWLFTDSGLVEAAPGNDRTTIARALKAAGYLHTVEGKLQVRIRLNGSRPRMYSVDPRIVDGEKARLLSKTGGPGGPSGPAQQQQGLEPVHEAETQSGPGGPPDVDQSTRTNPVHPVHSAKQPSGPPETRANTGVVHHVHPVHPKNREGEDFQAPDITTDRNVEVF